jgi:hypothetical protein
MRPTVLVRAGRRERNDAFYPYVCEKTDSFLGELTGNALSAPTVASMAPVVLVEFDVRAGRRPRRVVQQVVRIAFRAGHPGATVGLLALSSRVGMVHIPSGEQLHAGRSDYHFVDPLIPTMVAPTTIVRAASIQYWI